MESIVITGGKQLQGVVDIEGAKNAALPILAATLLTDGIVTLENIPSVTDTMNMLSLINILGKNAEKADNQLEITGKPFTLQNVPSRLMQAMRASVLILGPMLARGGIVSISKPGGCVLGSRPIDLHLEGFSQMGAQLEIKGDEITAWAPNGLHGAHIKLPKVTVTGTENLMMAAVLAEGETIIEGAAREPEITDLADMLTSMGARIRGASSGTIRIEGVPRLSGTTHRVIADRIEAGSYICMAAATKGHVFLKGVNTQHLATFLQIMEHAGLPFKVHSNGIEVQPHCGLKPLCVATAPYPGFPTDLQPQLMALMTTATGISLITETIFDHRMDQVFQLRKMGASIVQFGNSAVISAPTRLRGADLTANNLRAGAALITAALSASGTSMLQGTVHIDRGYADITAKLSKLGANIKRLTKSMDCKIPATLPA